MPKHEPTPIYFHLVGQLEKCMMRSDKLNWHNHGSYMEMTALSSDVNFMDEDESKEIIVHDTLSENNSKDVSESEHNIVNETLLQNNSADVPDNDISELKDNEHKEPSVTEKVTRYLTYSSVEEMYWINLTLRINNCSWQHQHKMNTIRR